MKAICSIWAILLLASTHCFAHFNWVVGLGGDESSGVSVSTDEHGNCFVAGNFSGTITLGTNVLSTAGGQDLFIAKIDAKGRVSWAFAAGGTSDDAAETILADPNGAIYVTGTLSSGAWLGVAETNSPSGPFVARITHKGKSDWVRTFPNAQFISLARDRRLWTAERDETNFVVSAWNDNGKQMSRIILQDAPFGVHDFAVGWNGQFYITGNATPGDRPMQFLTTFDRDGSLLWSTNPASGDPIVRSRLFRPPAHLAIARDGSVSVAGNISYPGSFSVGYFIARYAATSERLELGFFDEYRATYRATDIAVDRRGNTYVAGMVIGSDLSTDQRPAALIAGPNFSYIIKSESDGNPMSANAIDVDSDGYTYAVGHFTGTASFGSLAVGETLHGPSHAFITRLDDAVSRRGKESSSKR